MKIFTRKIVTAPVIIAIIFSFSCREKVSQPNANNIISLGTKDSLYSEVLKEKRNIWVYVPQHPGNPSAIKYPVLYLLDGDAHFYSVAGMIHQLSTVNGNTVCPEMIVVGIPNTDRTRDLTPTHVVINFFTGDSLRENSGGGGKFLDFIEKELIPYIDKKYPASGYRTFVGHSYGGLSVINALISRPQVFNNYVAIDPSLWWDNQAYLKYADSVLAVNKFNGRSLFVGVANTMSAEMNIQTVRSDTSRMTAHIRSILAFADNLEKIKNNGLVFAWKYFDDDDHGSVPLITEYSAIRFLFSWYRLPKLAPLFFPGSKALPGDLITALTAHYKNVSDHLGYNQFPPEEMINSLGYNFLSEKRFGFADSLFDLNIRNFPGSSNVWDSRGDSYLAQKDSLKALEYFTKSLQVGKNDFSQKKIDILKQKLKQK